jgi:hypothetical protein
MFSKKVIFSLAVVFFLGTSHASDFEEYNKTHNWVVTGCNVDELTRKQYITIAKATTKFFANVKDGKEINLIRPPTRDEQRTVNGILGWFNRNFEWVNPVLRFFRIDSRGKIIQAP